MLLGPTLVHNPSGISIGSAIFAVRESVIGMSGHALLLKIASSHGGSVPHPISGSLGPPDSASQTASIGSAVFAQFTAEYPYTLQQAAPFPQKFPLPMGGIWAPSNTWFLGPTRILNPNGILIGSAVFAGLITVTD